MAGHSPFRSEVPQSGVRVGESVSRELSDKPLPGASVAQALLRLDVDLFPSRVVRIHSPSCRKRAMVASSSAWKPGQRRVCPRIIKWVNSLAPPGLFPVGARGGGGDSAVETARMTPMNASPKLTDTRLVISGRQASQREGSLSRRAEEPEGGRGAEGRCQTSGGPALPAKSAREAECRSGDATRRRVRPIR